MDDWVCYLIMSLDSKETYIGSTNNRQRRLNDHNNANPSRKGAKRTRGKTWIPILYVSGFENKNACLSFESGWKRLSKKRNIQRLLLINEISNIKLNYNNDPKWNRIMDLLYFVHNITFIGTKFKLNSDVKHPVVLPENLFIEIMNEDWITELSWPYFINAYMISFD